MNTNARHIELLQSWLDDFEEASPNFTEEEAAFKAAIAALSGPPPQRDEPWGYLHTMPDGRWKVTKGSTHGGGFDTWAADAVPLYTAALSTPPAGMVLVPREPSEAMAAAAVDAAVNKARGNPWFPYAWRAAIRAHDAAMIAATEGSNG